MSHDTLDAAADELRKVPGVIECVTWSDSVSVRYSGPMQDLVFRARDMDLFLTNVEGVLVAKPMLVENKHGEIPEPEPPSVVEENDSIRTAYLIEEDGEQRLLVTTTGTEGGTMFMELNGPYGWVLDEAKEAQIRFGPRRNGSSFLLSRSTIQLRRHDPEHPSGRSR